MKPEKNIPFWLLAKNCDARKFRFTKTRGSYKCWYKSEEPLCKECNCPLLNDCRHDMNYVDVAKKIIQNGDSKLINMTPI